MNQTHGMGRARLLQMRLEQNSPPERPRMLGEYRPEPSLPIGIPIESFDAAKMAASISSRLRTISSREDDDEEQNSDPVAARHEKRSMSAPTSPYTPPIPKEPIRRGRGRAILLRARLPDYVVPGKPDDCSFPLDASPPAFFQRNEFRRRQLTEPSEALRTEIRFTGNGDEGPKETKPRVRGALNSVGSESSDMRDRAESISEEIEVENAVSQAEDATTSLDELSLNEAASEVER